MKSYKVKTVSVLLMLVIALSLFVVARAAFIVRPQEAGNAVATIANEAAKIGSGVEDPYTDEYFDQMNAADDEIMKYFDTDGDPVYTSNLAPYEMNGPYFGGSTKFKSIAEFDGPLMPCVWVWEHPDTIMKLCAFSDYSYTTGKFGDPSFYYPVVYSDSQKEAWKCVLG